ncbi:MAG: hypothetical protein AABX10_05380 [Nanoarchaeota archaeon]
MSISCVKCNYAVTEPLCAYCIVNEVKVWFYERKIKQKTIRQINNQLKSLLIQVDGLDYVVNPFEDISEESIMRCIKCSREMHLMCFYCVNNKTSQIVKNSLRSKEIKESFEESFNTGFYNYSLIKE